jgi:3-oxoacyl-[acyl-carrier protein] reductase
MGRASALSLAAEGARVAIAARSADTLEVTAAAAHDAGAKEVVQIVGDLTDPDHAAATVQRTIAAFGTLDVLVNTVGLCEPEPDGILATDDQVWARAWEGVLMVNVRLCRLAIPHMQANGGGAIVNIAAMSARHHLPMLSHYSSLKAALAHFTKNCAREFAPDHIRSNAVMPGLIASEGVVRRLSERQAELGIDDQAMFERTNDKYHDVTWWDRFGRPEEVGDVVAFLASPRASYMNGAMVNVDGGSIF